MQEMLSRNEDILFDLEQIKLLSQERVFLDRDEYAQIKKLPKNKRANEKKRLLAEKEQRKKEYIRRWILAVEERVRYSDLPTDVVNQILAMTTYVKERGVKFPYDIEQKMTNIEVQVQQAENNKQKPSSLPQESETKKELTTVAPVASVAAVSAVLWNKEAYEKRIIHLYNNKILDQLGTGQVKENISRPPEPKKQGSMYSKEHYRIMDKQDEEIKNAIVIDTQKRYKEKGLPIPTKETILTDLENMHPVKQRFAQKAIYKEDPELEKRHLEKQQALARREAVKNIAKMRLRVLKREKISVKTPNKIIEVTTEKTVESEIVVEQVSQKNQSQQTPTVIESENLKTKLSSSSRPVKTKKSTGKGTGNLKIRLAKISHPTKNKKTVQKQTEQIKGRKGVSKRLNKLTTRRSHRRPQRMSIMSKKQHSR